MLPYLHQNIPVNLDTPLLRKHCVTSVGAVNFYAFNFFKIGYFGSNQSGLVGNSSVGKILIGMRATLSAPLNLIPVSICLLSPYIKFHFILNNYN